MGADVGIEVGATVGVGSTVGVTDTGTAVGFGVNVTEGAVCPGLGPLCAPTEGGKAVGAMGATGALEAYNRFAYSLRELIASGRLAGKILASGSLSSASTSLTRTG